MRAKTSINVSKFKKWCLNMRKNEIFTSLLVFTLGDFALELFYPWSNRLWLWKIQPFIPSAPPAKLVVWAYLCFCIHVSLLSGWISGPVKARNFHFAVNVGQPNRGCVINAGLRQSGRVDNTLSSRRGHIAMLPKEDVLQRDLVVWETRCQRGSLD